MTIYIVCLFIILLQIPICSIIQNKKGVLVRINNENRNIEICQVLFFVDSVLLIAIAAFRSETVGTDSRAYFFWIEQLRYYSIIELPKWVIDSGIDIGYAFVSKIVYSIFQTKEIVLITINAIMFYGIYRFSYKLSINIIFCIYLFLAYSMFNQSMNVNGQYIASVFLLLSIKRAHRREIKSSILFLLIAVAFHTSAIIGLIFFPIAKLEKKAVRNSIFIVLVALVGSFFAPQVIYSIVSKTTYSVYLYKELASESGLGLAINALIFIAYIIFYRQFRYYDKYAAIWLYSTALTLGFNFYIKELAMIGRMMIYFKMMYIVSIPNFIWSFRDRITIVLIGTLIVILFGVYYWYSVSGSCFGTTPYVSEILGLTGR